MKLDEVANSAESDNEEDDHSVDVENESVIANLTTGVKEKCAIEEKPTGITDGESQSDENKSKFKDGKCRQNKEHIIIKMPEFNPDKMGGTMRLGKRKTFFVSAHTTKSVLCK